MAFFSVLFLVAGAGLCLVAAVGVLRLPDFFMRMHAATKAGVAGCGLLLIGVAFAEPSPGMWLKVVIAIAFLLLTQPIAGHLLARAGYVAGVPLWGGTQKDQLEGELPRGDFEQPAAARIRRNTMNNKIEQVVLGIAAGPGIEAAIAHAVELAKAHRVELAGLAIIDTKLLHDVGPVPLGASFYARQLRNTLTADARRRVAETIEIVEEEATRAGVALGLDVEEGDPIPILKDKLAKGVALVMSRHAWFDHGLADRKIAPMSRLARHRITVSNQTGDDDAPIVVFG
ncbi:monovalent cation/H(+) antiporter subunit G [Mesorhizobium sp. CAU 1741]|uniref:monovalent cation/H(+) antiporter subunit G n=1 Tax=Mesorhizobium sp. CAU 1741 TaxID=3140366 RepID=UPI00325C20A2